MTPVEKQRNRHFCCFIASCPKCPPRDSSDHNESLKVLNHQMGCGISNRILPHPADIPCDVNLAVEQELLAARAEDEKIIKCLLLGISEVGKSTILKQMKLLYCNGFSEEERLHYSKLIHRNILDAIQTLIQACSQLNIQLETAHSKQAAQRIYIIQNNEENLSKTFNNSNLAELRSDMELLWQDAGIQLAYSRCSEFHLIDSAQYYLSNVDRILVADYSARDEDILRSRCSTTGINETTFCSDNLTVKLFDVGGQRGERKKWFHCFDNITAILFVASLAEYDLVLSEDRCRNRMKESLDLFEGINNLPWFAEINIILFLNKEDIYRQKIHKVDLGVYLPAYTGGFDYEAGLDFIQQQYFNRNSNENKSIYCHVTNATNTANIHFVWQTTKHTILQQTLLNHSNQLQ
jgi:GTPase SAR1 family protein